MDDKEEAQGRRLLNAVERILAKDAALAELTARAVQKHPAREDEAEGLWRRRVAKALVSDFSNRAALSGGAAALPALVPGIGSVVALVGGSLADLALTLKFEVEMALCLSVLYGFDITRPRERELAFLQASVSTFDARANRSVLMDLAHAQGTALWNYTPRQVSKILAVVLGRLALLALSKSLVRVVPVLGMVVGASANRILTRRVGERCAGELEVRRAEETAARKVGPKVKARVRRARGR